MGGMKYSRKRHRLSVVGRSWYLSFTSTKHRDSTKSSLHPLKEVSGVPRTLQALRRDLRLVTYCKLVQGFHGAVDAHQA